MIPLHYVCMYGVPTLAIHECISYRPYNRVSKRRTRTPHECVWAMLENGGDWVPPGVHSCAHTHSPPGMELPRHVR